MILTGAEIESRLGDDIIINPFSRSRLGPNSYNLRLARELKRLDEIVVDCAKPARYKTLTIPDEGLVLRPNKLYLGATIEYTATNNLVPMIEGRSSIGRLGLFVHVTAGFGDVGFKGRWTLELVAIEPTRVYHGMELCQIFYHTLCGKVDRTYDGKYQNSISPLESQLWRDFK